MYSRTATLPRPRTAAPGNLRRCVGGAALGSTASAVLAIAASAARRGLVIDSAFVSKHDRLRNGDAPLTKHADKYVLRPLKFRPIDPRTGAPVPAEADPSQQQPSGIDRLDRGLPLESRRVVAEVEDEMRQTSGKPWSQLAAGRSGPVAAPLPDTVIRGHDPAAEYTGRVGTRALQEKRRPRSAAVTDAEDARPIDPLAERSIALENQIAATIESEGTPVLDRGRLLVDLVGRALEAKLDLSETTCDAIAATWYAALDPQRPLALGASRASFAISGDEDRVDPRMRLQTASALFDHSTLAADAEGTPIDAWPFHEHMVRLYFYMRGNFTAPSAGFTERLMVSTGAIANVKGGSNRLFHLCLRLLDDCDRYATPPSRVTLAAFFDVCAVHGQMDVALRRFADAQDQLLIAPDSQMCTAVIAGLTKNNMVNEAISFLARIEGVPADTTLLNATLEPLALSDEPVAAFAAYEAAVTGPNAVKPTSETFLRLLTACQRMEQWDRVQFVLAEMQRHKVKGDASTLNMLLKGLLLEGLVTYARVLLAAMRRKRVEVWPELGAVASRLVRAGEGKEAALSKPERDQLIGATAPANRGAARALAKVHTAAFHHRRADGAAVTAAAAKGHLDRVAPEKLQRFLIARGVLDPSDRLAQPDVRRGAASHEHLGRRVHRELYGVWPPQKGATPVKGNVGRSQPRRRQRELRQH
jgi:hypothetical protein